ANPSLAEVSQEHSERELAQLKSSITKINRWLNRANTEKTGLSKALEKQEKAISKLSKSIRTSKANITKQTKELKKLEKDHSQQTKALKKQQSFLIKQLQRAYLHGEQSQTKLLLNSNNPQELAKDMRFFAYINEARSEKISEVQDILNIIKNTEKKILVKKNKLHEQHKLQQQQRLELKKEQAARKQVLAKLKANIKNNTQRLEKMRKDQARLEKLLNELEQAIANIPLPDDAAPFSKQKTKLPWPAKGKVIGRFGSRIAQGKLKLNGIHIETKNNQEVQAIHSGRVIFSNWIRGFGLLIIIDHGNNYMSLYGNNKSLAKDTGDWVRAGEVLAYAGQSNAKSETGLYFEIRKDGKPLNPSRWLRK
ncbi:murein hydrolase activator EnvC, partial [Oleiphilus sp. HI0117]